jgi:6-phosphofructokinase 1
MGLRAVEELRKGTSGCMVGIGDGKMILTPLEKAIKGKSKIDNELVRVSEIMRL